MPRHLRYPCLILDHDDTVVASTPEIHYPAYLETMAQLRPQTEPLSLDGFFLKNFDPGFSQYMKGELGMSELEMVEEVRIWRGYSTTRVPSFFPGFLDFLEEVRSLGGKISVVSHSEPDVIIRNYRKATAGELLPDLVFGWETKERRRKPHPWPVRRTLKLFRMSRADALVVDDLMPGVLMARAAGVSVAAAGWGHDIPDIRSGMESECDIYLDSVARLRDLVLG